MLTLKVVSTDRNGQKSTYLLSGVKISYNYMIGNPGDVYSIATGNCVYGTIPDERKGDKNDFIYFGMRILNGDNAIIEDFLVFPNSECYIMEEGKTVDFFVSKFI